MQKSVKLLVALLSVCLLSVVTLMTVKPFENKVEDKSTFYEADSQTTKTVSKDKKEEKSSHQKSSDKSFQLEARDNTEKTVDPSSPVGNSVSKASDTQTSREGGMGAAIVTSGRLDLWEDTPVYTEPNKSGTIAFTKAKDTSVDWDKYFQENDDWWYSFVDKSSGQEIRYYIAYSDVKH